MGLKSLAAKLFNRTYAPQDIKRIETADLNGPGDEPHYYIADRHADGAFRISHVTLKQEPGSDFRTLLLRTNASPYTLAESVDLLGRIERETGLFAGNPKNKSNRFFVNSARPEAIRNKLQDRYSPSEIVTEMSNVPAMRIMELKQSSFETMERHLSRGQQPQRLSHS